MDHTIYELCLPSERDTLAVDFVPTAPMKQFTPQMSAAVNSGATQLVNAVKNQVVFGARCPGHPGQKKRAASNRMCSGRGEVSTHATFQVSTLPSHTH